MQDRRPRPAALRAYSPPTFYSGDDVSAWRLLRHTEHAPACASSAILSTSLSVHPKTSELSYNANNPSTSSLPGIEDYTNMHAGREFDMPDVYKEPWREQCLNVSEGRSATSETVGYPIADSA
ncbi:hypothetical protein E4U60_002669 [Claviceps pazoutovae]|uniref:Uncharacterized protein n=1 Tax=Claviceps pazoutovae TaxID=1649127 RepID=A0A9P7MBC5_9HYPO|nr:hypothetical protein E4U60_002669 [Claviceps pazoutovae]